jgi:hypothetical protein
MKKLLILFMVFINLSVFSQYAKVPDKGLVYDSLRNESYYLDYGYKNMYIGGMVTPGTEISKYVKHHYTGMILSFGGAAITSIGSFSYMNGNEFSGVVIGAGGILSLIGLIYTLEAPIHLKRAALIMDNNGVGVSIDLD